MTSLLIETKGVPQMAMHGVHNRNKYQRVSFDLLSASVSQKYIQDMPVAVTIPLFIPKTYAAKVYNYNSKW